MADPAIRIDTPEAVNFDVRPGGRLLVAVWFEFPKPDQGQPEADVDIYLPDHRVQYVNSQSGQKFDLEVRNETSALQHYSVVGWYKMRPDPGLTWAICSKRETQVLPGYWYGRLYYTTRELEYHGERVPDSSQVVPVYTVVQRNTEVAYICVETRDS
jgi:hypothetical protein